MWWSKETEEMDTDERLLQTDCFEGGCNAYLGTFKDPRPSCPIEHHWACSQKEGVISILVMAVPPLRARHKSQKIQRGVDAGRQEPPWMY